MDTYKDGLYDLVTVHGTAEELKVLCLHIMADAEAKEDVEIIQIKRRYQDVTRSYMSK